MFILFWFHEIIWKFNVCIFLLFNWSSLFKAYLKGASKRSLFLLYLRWICFIFDLFRNDILQFTLQATLIYFKMSHYRHYRSNYKQLCRKFCSLHYFFACSFCMFLTLHLFLRKLKESMKKRNIWNILFKWLYKNRSIYQP